MRIRFDMGVDFIEAAVRPKDQQNANINKTPTVPANENGLRWSQVPFPEGWYASP
jgi:hypothetical protein